ncbi:MAG TPA: acyltransferase family protein [Methylibium sp.]|nr:acyltransferase family protein [Methylibium sp.]
MQALPRRGYRADIDGLRAVAVLLVLVFHFDLLAAGKAGFVGVDVFFVISGYLITGIVWRQLERGEFGLAAFYRNRVRRLAPALLAVLLLTLAAGLALLLPHELLELGRQALASQFYLANLYFWRNVSYFGLGADSVFLLHTWSLAVEEQFYLLYPLLLLAVHRGLRRHLGTVLVVAFLLSFALNLAFVERKPEATFYLLPTRAWELLAGALLAARPAAARWMTSARIAAATGAAGIALIAAAVLSYSEATRFPGLFALLPVLGAVGVILAGSGGRGPVAALLSRPGVVYIGRISYPLYLVHWPMHVLAGLWLQNDYTWPLRAALFVAAFVLAALIHHLVEEPIRRRRVLAGDGRLLGGYAAGLAGTVLVFAAVQHSGGLPQRFAPEVVALAAQAADRSPPLSECEFSVVAGAAAVGRCRLGAPGAAARWLVYGDSHAWAAHDAFDRWLALKGEAGYFVFRHACPPLDGVDLFRDRGECRAFNRAVAAFLDAHREVDHVLLVSTWRQAAEGLLTRSSDALATQDESLRLFDAGFAATLSAHHARGRQVYVWEPVPGALANVPAAAARATLRGTVPALEPSLDAYRAEFAFFFAALERQRGLVAASFAPSRVLCATGRCAVSVDGRSVYFDNSHVARSSAPLWVEMMRRAEPGAGRP